MSGLNIPCAVFDGGDFVFLENVGFETGDEFVEGDFGFSFEDFFGLEDFHEVEKTENLFFLSCRLVRAKQRDHCDVSDFVDPLVHGNVIRESRKFLDAT